jgi:energy-coupling factor transport system ATP-binding protein
VLALDPRAKWLFLGLVSAAILLQNRWSGIVCSAAAALAVAACCRYPLRRFWPVLRAYSWFVALSAALSGLQLGGGDGGLLSGLRFSVPHALATVQPLVRLVPVMLLGLLFGRTTSYTQVKRGLEQSLAPLMRWRAQAEALTFTAAMMFRLIPLLTQLFERLSRIARTRGKSRAKPGVLALRDVPVVLVPFLLSAFQMAEQLSLAAESKGYRIGLPRTSALHLRFKRKDIWTVAVGGAIFMILWRLRG